MQHHSNSILYPNQKAFVVMTGAFFISPYLRYLKK